MQVGHRWGWRFLTDPQSDGVGVSGRSWPEYVGVLGPRDPSAASGRRRVARGEHRDHAPFQFERLRLSTRRVRACPRHMRELVAPLIQKINRFVAGRAG